MASNKPLSKQSVSTPSGRISYTDRGTGPVALFVHGVLLNNYLWRYQQEALSDIRRTIAVDLLAHGKTEIGPGQDVSVTANAKMLAEFLDALAIDKVDIVGNDSGGGICQIFCALYSERVRSLTLTDCDTHDNWPPVAFQPFVAMVKAGGLRKTLDAMLSDKAIYRSHDALGPAYEHPGRLSDDTIERYLRPLVATEQRTRDLERFVNAFDNKHTVAIEPKLKTFQAPTLIHPLSFDRRCVLARGHRARSGRVSKLPLPLLSMPSSIKQRDSKRAAKWKSRGDCDLQGGRVDPFVWRRAEPAHQRLQA